MEERTCFVCSLNYKLPTRKPHILECCSKNVCSECLIKIIEEGKKCPNCQTTLLQPTLNFFSVNVEIEETLRFEQFGDLKCNQCIKKSDMASKFCADCGLICCRCYFSHVRMKIFETHKIGPIPEDKWSKKLETALKISLNCDKHRDKKKEYFCKYCEKSVCEECIVESHSS